MQPSDIAEQTIIPNLPWMIAGGLLLGALGIIGWIFTTWLRVKNGYPLANSWGLPLHPKTDRESIERIRLLTTENAQLRAELGSVKDRLETLERIATDQPSKLAREIDGLAFDKGGRA
jgi:hypothetical protein